MKKRGFRLLALALVAALLAGCSLREPLYYLEGGSGQTVLYSDMAYSRPDMTELEQSADTVCEAAEGTDAQAIIDALYDFYDLYDSFYTNSSLSNIQYSADLTDTYWEEEYTYCAENSATVDAALEEIYYALAASPCREELDSDAYFGPDFLSAYDGENLWDEEYTALAAEEAQLENRYYALAAATADTSFGTDAYFSAGGDEMLELLVQLIGVRQEMAALWGYDSYPDFASVNYYGRDYTAADMESLLEDVRRELVPLYQTMIGSDFYDTAYEYCSEKETYAYVESMAHEMGGTIEEAFELLDEAGLYDIAYGENKYDSSFEVYLTSYAEPFIFMNPGRTRYDCLTFAHEFGHFCNDYASYGSNVSIDVAEIFSQGMEYLSLCYGDDGEELTRLKLADGLATYVEQAAYAAFELRMYSLTGDDLSVDGLCRLYDEIARSYGFESVGYDAREFVTIPHYYTYPMYIISYVVSNDAAMQLYRLEQESAGSGLRCLTESLDTQSACFLEFLEETGLESPFGDGHIAGVKETLESALGL